MSKLTRLFIDATPRTSRRCRSGSPTSASATRRSSRSSSSPSCASSSTATTGRALSEIDPLQVIREAFALIYRMNLHLPTRFVMLDKAIATLGSVGVELYPDFNVFEIAKPYARSLMLERFTPRRVAGRARRQGWELAQMAAEVPYQLHDMLEELRDGQIEVGFVHKGLDEFMQRMNVAFNRLVVALVVTGGLIGSSLIGIFATRGPPCSASTCSRSSASSSPAASASGCCGACSAPGRL